MVNSRHLRYSTIAQIAHQKIVPGQVKKTLFVCTLLAFAGLLASCGGSSSGGIYNQTFNVSGQWSGTISDADGSTDTINATLSDNAGSITGTLTLNGHSCLSSGSVTGTAVQDSANTAGDNPLTGDQENSNNGSVSLTVSTHGLGNSVSSITVTAGGTGYTQDTDVVIEPPDLSNGVQATATATIAAGIIVGFVVTENGYGYLEIPSVTVVDQDTLSGGEGAVATAVLTTTTDNPTFTLIGTSKQLSGSYSTTNSCSINSTNTVSLTRI